MSTILNLIQDIEHLKVNKKDLALLTNDIPNDKLEKLAREYDIRGRVPFLATKAQYIEATKKRINEIIQYRIKEVKELGTLDQLKTLITLVETEL